MAKARAELASIVNHLDTDKGGIIRVNKNAAYFSASNEPFIDTRLSW